jgi:TetR/AcrR family transcriptional regulator
MFILSISYKLWWFRVTFVDMMSNEVSDELKCVEEIIMSKAKELFFVQGKTSATVQEIADFAGIQRTSVNYYYRSKQNLLCEVYRSIIEEMKSGLDTIYDKTIAFEAKVDELIHFMMDFRLRYPYFEIFNIQEIGEKMRQGNKYVAKSTESLNRFLNEIQEQIDMGNLSNTAPYDFLLNLSSLVNYPLVMKPIFMDLYHISSEEYDVYLTSRKQFIKQLLLKK